MINRDDFYKAFMANREQAAARFDRTLTDFDRLISDRMFEAAYRAMGQAEDGRFAHFETGEYPEAQVEAVSITTGGGKSQSAYALIAAAASLDSDFTAAYIVPTVKMGIEAQEGIEALLGEGSTTLWSWCHKDKGRDTGRINEELGFVPDRVHSRSEIPQSRIVILTHKFLKAEMLSDIESGARHYMGMLRDLVFVDEHPDMVDIVDAQASDVMAFHDQLALWQRDHAWLPILTSIATRMSKTVDAVKQGYVSPGLVSEEEAAEFESVGLSDIVELIREPDWSVYKRHDVAEEYFKLVRLFKAASRVSSFYSAKDKTFFGYEFPYKPMPGFVMLDATSDINGLHELHPNIHVAKDVPQVNYERLTVKQTRLPKAFRNIGETTSDHELGSRYGRWMQRVVLANTQPGDEVLVVTHKKVLDLHFLKPAKDVSTPADWDGRSVNTMYWGAGVGENKWNHKTHVFLFGEFHVPRHKTISDRHAWGEKPVSDDVLSKAISHRASGSIYQPKDEYLSPYKGHLLRWSKQLAMRGNARNIDGQGRCGEMTLVVTTALPELVEHFHRLYPGADLPRPAKKPSGIEDLSEVATKGDGLVELMMDPNKSLIGADEVKRVTGIDTNKLKGVFESASVAKVAAAYDWILVSAKDLGRSGRMKYLVRRGMSEASIAA